MVGKKVWVIEDFKVVEGEVLIENNGGVIEIKVGDHKSFGFDKDWVFEKEMDAIEACLGIYDGELRVLKDRVKRLENLREKYNAMLLNDKYKNNIKCV